MRRSYDNPPPIAPARKIALVLFASTVQSLLVSGAVAVAAPPDKPPTGRSPRDTPPAELPLVGATHHFAFRAPAAGRETVQDVTFSLQLKSTTVQRGATVEEVETKLTRRQTRLTTVLATDEDRVTKARVLYRVAEQEADGKRGGKAIPAARTAHAVSGKTYIVARAKPADALSIADDKGQEPPPEERDLVAANMDAIGRDNVLGKLLDRRTIRVGQTVEVPRDAVGALLGLDRAMGEVARFDLTLARVARRGDALCGEFDTRIELAPVDAGGQATRFRGRMVVEIDTCRLVEADLAGPVSLVENHSLATSAYQVFSAGVLSMRMKALPAESKQATVPPQAARR